MNNYKPIEKSIVVAENHLVFEPKITVIIPCYNVASYVEECLESIQEQTLQEIEIVCIDDGSTDDTLCLLKQRAEQDRRITVLTQSNSGQGYARNQGALLAKGNYLYFMDGDDLLQRDALERLYTVASAAELDVLYFDGVSFYENEELMSEKESYADYYIRKHDYSNMKTGLDMLCAMKMNEEYRHSPCLQLIKNSYFQDKQLWYIPGVFHEDNFFTFQTMLLATKVGHVAETYFQRRIRTQSVMTSRETFKHCYGYFISYLNMLRLAWEEEPMVRNSEQVSQIVSNAVKNARKIFKKLADDEREKYKCLPPLERDSFEQLVIRGCKKSAPKKETQRKNIIARIFRAIWKRKHKK